jgi:hypothetical protein
MWVKSQVRRAKLWLKSPVNNIKLRAVYRNNAERVRELFMEQNRDYKADPEQIEFYNKQHE